MASIITVQSRVGASFRMGPDIEIMARHCDQTNAISALSAREAGMVSFMFLPRATLTGFRPVPPFTFSRMPGPC
jgi:hypothetical protein